MKKKRIILCIILVIGIVVTILFIVNTKRYPVTDYSESSYIYEENDLGTETNENIDDFTPIEKE